MKLLIYRFSIWLENRAIDLQDWAAPEYEPIEYEQLVIGGINRDPSEFWKSNAFAQRLIKENDQ